MSELLYQPLPVLPTSSQKSDSILIGSNTNDNGGDDADEISFAGAKWEDEEERRFFEDVQDLKDFVPKSVLGIDGDDEKEDAEDTDTEKSKAEREKEEVRKLEEELEKLSIERDATDDPTSSSDVEEELNEEECVSIPLPRAS